MPDDIRVGVFVCHCGRNIGAYLDVPKVVEYAKQLPNVVHAEHNLFTCSEVGISAIKQAIKDHNLNRVIVASCTPRTHEPLFRSACEEEGLNKYLFEFVNIRDQCSWVHMDHYDEATEKAKTLVRMGVAKASLLEPLDEMEIEVTPAALVIGGGIAGMSAALNLANQGFDIHLVEKSPQLGGMLLDLYKLYPTDREAKELVSPMVDRVNKHPKIKTYLSSEVREVAGFIGNFSAIIDASKETKKSGVNHASLNIGAVIIATGAEELKPEGLYGYGEMTGVLTQLELEKEMQRGKLDGHNFVMINCVGSRCPERPYCSRFCCLTAIKNAALIKEANPNAKVWLLHRDIMAYGVEFEDYYRRAMEAGVRFIRYSQDRPPEVNGTWKVENVKVYHQLLQQEIDLPADTVVLTTPLIPRSSNPELSKMLKVPLSQEGFFLEAHLKLQPIEFATDGIFLCGSARWPVEVAEAIFQAYAAASKAAIPMRRGYVKPEAITSSVDQEQCSGCGICVSLCPYNALEFKTVNNKRVSSNITALCKGCGICGATCPSGAITMNHFKDEQILAQIEAATA